MSVQVDEYVIDSLLPDLVGHDRAPSAFLVYLVLWRRTRAARGRAVAVSYRELAADSGLSKASVQLAVKRLRRRRLLEIRQASITAVPEYRVLRPWRRATGQRAALP